jgi:hypothetical protein
MSGSLFGEDDDPGESVGVGALPDECDRIGDAPQVDGVENGLKNMIIRWKCTLPDWAKQNT